MVGKARKRCLRAEKETVPPTGGKPVETPHVLLYGRAGIVEETRRDGHVIVRVRPVFHLQHHKTGLPVIANALQDGESLRDDRLRRVCLRTARIQFPRHGDPLHTAEHEHASGRNQQKGENHRQRPQETAFPFLRSVPFPHRKRPSDLIESFLLILCPFQPPAGTKNAKKGKIFSSPFFWNLPNGQSRKPLGKMFPLYCSPRPKRTVPPNRPRGQRGACRKRFPLSEAAGRR